MMRSIWEKIVVWGLGRMDPVARSITLNRVIKKSMNATSSKSNLIFLLELDNRLYKLQSTAAKTYESGSHPKHRLTQYHDFFINNIKPGESVVDIGSGTGALAFDVASSIYNVKVVGIECDATRVKQAKRKFSSEKVNFIQGMCPQDLPQESFDVVMMSNILEHLDNRVEVLKQIQLQIKPKRFLIRVPQYDRDWRVPLKDELGVDSRLSQSHYIEYRPDVLAEELKQSGLIIDREEFHWGEIWLVAKPK